MDYKKIYNSLITNRRVISEIQMGENNSQYGTMWIHKGINNKKIMKGSQIPIGWTMGRQIKAKINTLRMV